MPAYIPVGKGTGSKSPAKAIAVINDQLDRQNIVGINFEANLILKRPVTVSGHDDESMMPITAPDNSQHAVSVVGRRLNRKTGNCELKIRNSWGTGCDAYREPYASTCSNGHIWISESDLAPSLTSVTYLPN